MECARVGRTGKERLPPEDESKHLQPVTAIVFREGEKAFVMAREIEKSREIHLKKLLRDGTGALIVEPPPCTVGENAPAEFAGGQVVHAPKIAEHLGRGRGLLTPAPGAAIKWPAPAFGLDDREAELIALPFLGKAVGAVLCCSVWEQQAIGHVLPAVSGEVLLPKACRPPELRKDRPDQIVFGLAFIG